VWSFKWGNNTDGTFPLVFVAYGLNEFEANTTLNKDLTYRIEFAFHRVTSTTWNVELRIYDQAGSLVLTEADFIGYASTSLAGYNWTISSASLLRLLWCGENDWGSWAPSQEETHYFGGVCVRADDWCGPYSGGV
jgi:hypothetical protein